MDSSRLTQVLVALTENKLTLKSREKMSLGFQFGDEGQFKISIANDRQTREAAYHLLYKAYLEKGFAKKHASGMWYSLYDAHPDTITLAVKLKSKVVGALSIVFDSLLGLPCEELYADEINALRAKYCLLAEIISLEIEKNISGASEVLLKLFNFSCIVSKKIRGASDLLVTANPRYTLFYKRKLLFKEIGEEKAYDKVGGAPAVLLKLDLSNYETIVRKLNSNKKPDPKKRQTLFESYLTEEEEMPLIRELKRQHTAMSKEDLRYFFRDKRKIFAAANEKDLRYLQVYYPGAVLPQSGVAGH